MNITEKIQNFKCRYTVETDNHQAEFKVQQYFIYLTCTRSCTAENILYIVYSGLCPTKADCFTRIEE